MLGLFRRQAARAQEEPIPEDLIASIPVVAGKNDADATTFAIEHEEVIAVPPAPPSDAPQLDAGLDASAAPPGPANAGSAVAQQLRYDLGEALARELDRGVEAIGAAFAEIEARLAQAEADLAAARAEAEHERALRETAEKRLSAFKELALK